MTPVAVTGYAALTPLGDRVDALVEALAAGRCAVLPQADLGGAGAATMADFDATTYCNVRGLRLYSRPTRLGIAAVAVALGDAGLQPAQVAGEGLGTVTASTFGHLETLFEYDRSVVAAGPLRGNPALMPLALPSSPGAAIALSFGAKAFSLSLSDGGASSLDALGLGARLVAEGRARVVVVVGAFGLCPELQAGARRAGLLAPDGALRPFDRRRQGTALADGAAAVVLERLEDARARRAEPRGFVAGQASAFSAEPAGRTAALARACRAALAGARVAPAEVGLVSSGAGGSVEGDRAEARALAEVLGAAAPHTPVAAVKGNLGDAVDASGLLQAVVALAALREGRAPPIAGLEAPEVAGLGYLERAAPVAAPSALVTATSFAGAASALVLTARHDG
jgi:3-oxoacyl-[acyl-carrier-protein] synthase II